MRVREKLARKVMAVVIAAAAVFVMSGGTKVATVKAEGEAVEVIDSNGQSVGKYYTCGDAMNHIGNDYTIKVLASSIGGDVLDVGDKNLTIDLNGNYVGIFSISTSRGLTIKNGTMSTYIDNASSGGDYGTLVVDNAQLILSSGMQWMSDGGMQVKNGSGVSLSSGLFNLTKLSMDQDCVFSVECPSGIFNYGRPGNGFEAVKDFLPEGYSVGVYSRGADNIQTIKDENGNNATNYTLRYRRLSDSMLSVTLDPDTYVYDGKEKRPAVTVSYEGQTLTEGVSYTLTYANNKNAGTASVTIDGKNTLHGQLVKEFTIKKANQNAPTGLTPTAESDDGKKDGQIANLTTAMEYSVDQTNWTACTGTTLTKLSAGDYYVRYKETSNYFASPSAKVVVAKGTVPATTGTQTTTETETTEATTTQTTETTENPTTETSETTENPTTQTTETTENLTTRQTLVEQPDASTTQADTTKPTDAHVATGDAYPLTIMITLMLGAGVCIAGMIRRRKNEE